MNRLIFYGAHLLRQRRVFFVVHVCRKKPSPCVFPVCNDSFAFSGDVVTGGWQERRALLSRNDVLSMRMFWKAGLGKKHGRHGRAGKDGEGCRH